MTDRRNSISSLGRSILLSRCTGLGIALFIVVAGCGAGGSGDQGESASSALATVCPASIAPWAVGTPYKVGELVSFKGEVFSCRQAHTAEDGWFPDIVLALWLPVQCAKGGGNPAPAPAPKPTATTPPAPPPAPPPAATGGGNTGGQCVGGPKFDPAGVKNVGNGAGHQFIGGQCLSHADCNSGCCAFPCGICSGPGAQFQAGKKGCGFGG